MKNIVYPCKSIETSYSLNWYKLYTNVLCSLFYFFIYLFFYFYFLFYLLFKWWLFMFSAGIPVVHVFRLWISGLSTMISKTTLQRQFTNNLQLQLFPFSYVDIIFLYQLKLVLVSLVGVSFTGIPVFFTGISVGFRYWCQLYSIKQTFCFVLPVYGLQDYNYNVIILTMLDTVCEIR